MKDSKKNYHVGGLYYLFECYSHDAREVVKMAEKYTEDFTEEERAHFYFEQRVFYDHPYPKFLGGKLTDKQREICERIKKENDVDFL